VQCLSIADEMNHMHFSLDYRTEIMERVPSHDVAPLPIPVFQSLPIKTVRPLPSTWYLEIGATNDIMQARAPRPEAARGRNAAPVSALNNPVIMKGYSTCYVCDIFHNPKELREIEFGIPFLMP
jgi:hypothetical protein